MYGWSLFFRVLLICSGTIALPSLLIRDFRNNPKGVDVSLAVMTRHAWKDNERWSYE